MKRCCFLMGIVWMCLCILCPCYAAEQGDRPMLESVVVDDGSTKENIRFAYPVVVNGGPHTEKINNAIREKMNLSAYQKVLQLGAGSIGLQVDWEGFVKGDILSLVVSCNGKMPVGRPSQVYYPMNFDLKTGEEITFDTLFSDVNGAKTYIEEVLENEIQESLSTHLENASLFPVPYDRFNLDVMGGITLWYEKEQLSFLSGYSGAVHFRYSELENWLSTKNDSITDRILSNDTKVCYLNGCQARNFIGHTVEDMQKAYRFTVDSEYYPGGACYEVENAEMRGTLILTDENEEKVLGLLSSRMDDGSIITGKTTWDAAVSLLGDDAIILPMDEGTAEIYKVCTGNSITCKTTVTVDGKEAPADYTLYANEAGIIQYIRLVITE